MAKPINLTTALRIAPGSVEAEEYCDAIHCAKICTYGNLDSDLYLTCNGCVHGEYAGRAPDIYYRMVEVVLKWQN